MSASAILATAPLGALIRYSDGRPRPSARFVRKLAAWERSNGFGRLVKKEPPRVYPTWTAPGSFTLHEGDFASGDIVLVTLLRSHSADSPLAFEVTTVPAPGHVRVLLDVGGNPELLHLAASVAEAELWIVREGCRTARIECVGAEGEGQGRAGVAG